MTKGFQVLLALVAAKKLQLLHKLLFFHLHFPVCLIDYQALVSCHFVLECFFLKKPREEKNTRETTRNQREKRKTVTGLSIHFLT